MKNIIHQHLNLPADAPVMILPNALLFPNLMMPLYIFEERYRAMLDDCLKRDRMFCIALMKPGVEEAADDEEDFYHTAGLGMIRACVGNQDGTSQLMLQGLARVRFTNFIQHEPYRVAQIQELRSSVENVVEAEALGVKVREICQSMKDEGSDLLTILNKQLSQSSNPEVISDFVAQAFVRDPFQRQEILQELSVSERLRMLIDCLHNKNG